MSKLGQHAFRVEYGSLQDRFLKSRSKIQFYGGGFANGKTSASCIKALQIAREYPGSNGLIARATYPKLEDTIKKEFLKWCPKAWIKSKTNNPNNIVLENGTTINFRYVVQQGKSAEASTSNLLSATYDWIIVDQIEDPEIVHKDFLDLMGRLRGMAKRDPSLPYDPTMPATGPRWMIITSNPTRNWVYTELIKPCHDYADGKVNENLVKDVDTGKPLIEIFEGSTYDNAANLEMDYIKGLEATYTGQMKERFLMGKWGAFEGLVYPEFDETIHVLPDALIQGYFQRLRGMGVSVEYLQGYDYGLVSPSVFGLAFVDTRGNIFVCDGFYRTSMAIEDQAKEIIKLQTKWGVPPRSILYGDPAIFRNTSASRTLVGESVAAMFAQDGVYMTRGNNDVANGIQKVSSYLRKIDHHMHPLFSVSPAPRIYFAESLTDGIREFGTYRWKRDTSGDETDKPVDKDDHFLDMLKYMLTKEPKIGRLNIPRDKKVVGLRNWAENNDDEQGRLVRHA